MRSDAASARWSLCCFLPCLVAVLLLPTAAHAKPSPPSRFILVLCNGLTLDDLYGPSLPRLRELAMGGAIGLMNTAVSGSKTDTAAVLTIALGSLAPSEPTDDDIYQADEPVERATADVVFRRRTGIDLGHAITRSDSASTLVHLGIAPLVRRGLNAQTFGAVIGRTGRQLVVAAGNAASDDPQRGAGLFAVDERGIGPPGLLSTSDPAALAEWTLKQHASVVVQIAGKGHDQTVRTLDTFLAAVSGRINPATTRLLVVSPHPPDGPNGEWDRLTPVVLSGAGTSRGFISSATTRTTGLIANIDIAPTLLSWLSVPVPATMTGHPVTVEPRMRRRGVLLGMDRMVTANAHGQVLVFAALAVIAVLVVFGGLAVIAKRPQLGLLPARGVLFLMNMPLAMLLAVFLSPASVPALLGYILAFMLAGCLLQAHLIENRESRIENSTSPIRILALLTCLTIVIDAFFGQWLVKFSLFSFYQLQGIRFYGIGNEYMAVHVGMGLLVPFLVGWKPWLAALWFALLTAVLGLPALGADAGGIVGALAAFGCAWQILRGRRVTALHAAGWVVAGVALAVTVALVERSTAGGGASHIGGALQAAGQRGYGYLAEIAWRKVQMNGRILAHPAMLAALAAITALWALGRGPLERTYRRLVQDHTDWARAWPAFGYGALAAFLFNDSGIVAAAFIFGAYLMAGLYFLFSGAAQSAEPHTVTPEAPSRS